MSASLVGSEMCIRDSPSHEHAEHAGYGVNPGDGIGHFDQRLPSPYAQSAVSYTHLTLPTICSV
eukprot:11601025-Alexandrium_andersonii.AAC.1